MKCKEIQVFAIVEQKSVKIEEREKESDHGFINKIKWWWRWDFSGSKSKSTEIARNVPNLQTKRSRQDTAQVQEEQIPSQWHYASKLLLFPIPSASYQCFYFYFYKRSPCFLCAVCMVISQKTHLTASIHRCVSLGILPSIPQDSRDEYRSHPLWKMISQVWCQRDLPKFNKIRERRREREREEGREKERGRFRVEKTS